MVKKRCPARARRANTPPHILCCIKGSKAGRMKGACSPMLRQGCQNGEDSHGYISTAVLGSMNQGSGGNPLPLDADYPPPPY